MIDYCLSKPIGQNDKLQFSLVIMIIVNLIMIFSLGLTAWKLFRTPLLTLGDSIASFLDIPDSNTANNCLTSKYHFHKSYQARSNTVGISTDGPNSDAAEACLADRDQLWRPGWEAAITKFQPKRYFWFSCASLKRSVVCISQWVIFTAITRFSCRGPRRQGVIFSIWNAICWTFSCKHLVSNQFSIEGNLSNVGWSHGNRIFTVIGDRTSCNCLKYL